LDRENERENGSDSIYSKLEEMDNKLERIKSDTHNLNRIASLSNSSLIIQELKKLIGDSQVRAAVLHLTKDEIKAGDLAAKLGVNPANLAFYIKPFLGNKGYIALIKRGRERYYQRSELVDLIGFESVEVFAALIKSWKDKKQQASKADINTPAEGANVG
jgi:DNA-binding transcriptional ArsR family regulator